MSTYEFGSIFVRSPKMQLLLDEVSQTCLSKQVIPSFLIVGEAGSGKSTMAQHIQKIWGKEFAFKLQKNVVEADEIQPSGSYILTMTPQNWIRLRNDPRLSAFKVIVMPLLKERKQDLLPLADFFLQVFSLMKGQVKAKLTDKAAEMILQYSWPGNFHEFEAVLENAFEAAAQCGTGLIEPDMLGLGKISVSLELNVGMKLEEIERSFILQTLYFVHQNRTKAAEILGISIRTLRNKINQYRQEGYL